MNKARNTYSSNCTRGTFWPKSQKLELEVPSGPVFLQLLLSGIYWTDMAEAEGEWGPCEHTGDECWDECECECEECYWEGEEDDEDWEEEEQEGSGLLDDPSSAPLEADEQVLSRNDTPLSGMPKPQERVAPPAPEDQPKGRRVCGKGQLRSNDSQAPSPPTPEGKDFIHESVEQ